MRKAKHPSFFINGVEYKKCSKCLVDKLIDKFANKKKKYHIVTYKYVRAMCKECRVIVDTKYRENNKEQFALTKKKSSKKFNQKNKEKIKIYHKTYNSTEENIKKRRERDKKYWSENKEILILKLKKSRVELKDSYVKEIIFRQFGLERKEIPEIMIKYKRLEIAMKRGARKSKKQTKNN